MKTVNTLAAILAGLTLFLAGCGGRSSDVSPAQPVVADAPADIRFVNVPTDGKNVIPGAKDQEMTTAQVDCEGLCPSVTELIWQAAKADDLSAFTNYHLVRSDGTDVNTEAPYTVVVDKELKQVALTFFDKFTATTGRVPQESYSLIADVATSAGDGATLTLGLKTVQPHEATTTVRSSVQGGEFKVAMIPGVNLPVITGSSSAFPQIDPSLLGFFVPVGNVTVFCPAENLNSCSLSDIKIITGGLFSVQVSVGGTPIGFISSIGGSLETYNVSFVMGPGTTVTFDLSAVVTDTFVFLTVPARDMSWSVFGPTGQEIRVNAVVQGGKDKCGNIVTEVNCGV
jgi:hypothetical protein